MERKQDLDEIKKEEILKKVEEDSLSAWNRVVRLGGNGFGSIEDAKMALKAIDDMQPALDILAVQKWEKVPEKLDLSKVKLSPRALKNMRIAAWSRIMEDHIGKASEAARDFLKAQLAELDRATQDRRKAEAEERNVKRYARGEMALAIAITLATCWQAWMQWTDHKHENELYTLRKASSKPELRSSQPGPKP